MARQRKVAPAEDTPTEDELLAEIMVRRVAGNERLPGERTVKEISQATGVDENTLGAQLRRLAAKGELTSRLARIGRGTRTYLLYRASDALVLAKHNAPPK